MWNLSQSKNKLGNTYLLTPIGTAKNSIMTAEFLKLNVDESELLKAEAKVLKVRMNFAMGGLQ